MAFFTPSDSVAASFTPPIGRLAFPTTTTFRGLCLELSTECLVQQGFFQRFQRGELLLVDGFEALGFFAKGVKRRDNSSLDVKTRKRKELIFERAHVYVVLRATLSLLLQPRLQALKLILQKFVTRNGIVCHNADDAVRKAGIEGQYPRFGDICG